MGPALDALTAATVMQGASVSLIQSKATNEDSFTATSTRQPDSYLNPERFWVDYLMEAHSEEQARKFAWDLCLEQTVELPGKTQVVQEVLPYVVGSIERIRQVQIDPYPRFRVTIAYPNDTAGDELTQFINVVFGNTSLKKGVSVENVTLSQTLEQNIQMFPGPQFGIQGLRKLLGVPQAPLLCTALKPMGKSAPELANMAYHLARGGMDIIKDDHGLANQVWAPYDERVRLCAEAVQKANNETGKRCIYAACLNAPAEKLIERAYYAKQVGAGAVMALPGISGFDIIRELASRHDFHLPILVHPAMLGGWLHESHNNSHPHGLSHEFLFGMLPRLCGGDAVIFPNAGGRFQFSSDECQAIPDGCRRPMGRFKPILPSPAGGMKLSRVPEMRSFFGDDTLLLIGGALLEQGPNLEVDAQLFVHCAGRDQPYSPPQGGNDAGEESKAARHRISLTSRSSSIAPGPSTEDVERVARNVRRRVLEYTLRNNGGYLSQACSSAETLATLYLRALKLGPSVAPMIPGPFRGSPREHLDTLTGEGYNGDPADASLDRLIFSPVHYALVLYALLVEVGRLDIAAFESFNKDGSTVELIGAEHSPGHAVTAGSLAQALSQGAGIAHARNLKNHSGRVVVYMSDGEYQEGQTWEAVQALVYHKVSNLTAVVDVNKQQCDGKMESVMGVGDLATKLRAFGAHVHEVDGHDVGSIEWACQSHCRDKPTFVLCNTDPCRGFPLLRERAPKLHYVRFKNAEEKATWETILENMGETAAINVSPEKQRVVTVDNNDSEPPATANFAQEKPATQSREQGSIECIDPQLIEISTRPHRSNLVSWMKAHPKAIVLTADLTSSCEADLLRDSLPEQYLSLGMAEQNMMSFAGGLAREGFHPFIHTFGVFITRRPFDQVAMSIGVPNLPVRLLGFLPGLTTPGGVTHQAIDDIALMRSIPNMRILECGDATEVESVLDVAESIDGPVYIRMLRGEVPRFFPKTTPMKLGQSRVLSLSSQQQDNDITVVTAGICTEEGIMAVRRMKEQGVHVAHIHLSSIVPFPAETILTAAQSCTYGIISMENHSIIGGIGSAIAEVLAEAGVGKKLIRLGVPGVYAHGASRAYLLSEYGLDASALIRAAETLLGRALWGDNGVTPSRAVELENPPSHQGLSAEERPEDL